MRLVRVLGECKGSVSLLRELCWPRTSCKGSNKKVMECVCAEVSLCVAMRNL